MPTISHGQATIRNIIKEFFLQNKSFNIFYIPDYRTYGIFNAIDIIIDFIESDELLKHIITLNNTINKNKNKNEITSEVINNDKLNYILLSHKKIIIYIIVFIPILSGSNYDKCFEDMKIENVKIMTVDTLLSNHSTFMQQIDMFENYKNFLTTDKHREILLGVLDDQKDNINQILMHDHTQSHKRPPHGGKINREFDINKFTIIPMENTSLVDINEADAWVNAASVSNTPMASWSGVAAVIKKYVYKLLNTADQTIFNDDWTNRGNKVQSGTSDFVKDSGNGGIYHKMSNGKYIIHTGPPPSGTNDVKLMEQSYSSIFNLIEQFNDGDANNRLNDKINSVAIPPLGIGVYNIPPDISVTGLVNAIKKHSQKFKLTIYIPLFMSANTKSTDFTFYDIFLKEIHK